MNNKRKACFALLVSAVLASVNITVAAERYVNEVYINSYSNNNWSNIDAAGKRFEAPDDMEHWGEYYDEKTHSYKPLPREYAQVGEGAGNYNLVDGQYVNVGPGNGSYILVAEYNYGDLMPGQEAVDGGGFENWGIVENFSNNTFQNNKADTGGGMANWLIITDMKNNTFTNNTAVQDGGAIYNYGAINNITGTFTGNKAQGIGNVWKDGDSGNGGGIFNLGLYVGENEDGKHVLSSSYIGSIDGKFDQNSAQWHGGAIYNSGQIGTIEGTYTNNTAITGRGGAIHNVDNMPLYVPEEDKGEQKFGAIESIDGTFSGNSALQGGGAIYNGGKIGTVSGDFTNNGVNGEIKTYDGGALMNEGEIETLGASTFKGNTAISKGGAVYNAGTMGSAGNIKYQNNSAEMGGAIANDGKFNISRYSTFSGNKALENGGALYNTGEITTSSLANQSFTDNIADAKGGAIFNEGKMALGGKPDGPGGSQNSVTFKGNNAQDGGAIYNAGDLTVQKTTFDNNTAVNGGAIYQKTSAININNLKFTNNKAEKGGAIYAGEGSTVTLGNNEFRGNTAQKGGVLYLENSIANINAQSEDILFDGNTAEKGSAVYIENGTLNLNASNGRNITFNDNIAGTGVINTSGNIILNNSVTPDGGALRVNVNSGIIKSSVENYLNGTDLHLANGTTLDLMNGKTGVLNLNSLTSDNANLKIDMDLANSSIPLDIINANTASGTLNISDINFISEMLDGNNHVSAPMNIDQLTLNFPGNNMHIITNNSFYVITKGDNNISIDRLHDDDGNPVQLDGFALAVNKDAKVGGIELSLNDERSFSATEDVKVTASGFDDGWTGKLGGTKLTVNGNGHTIDGNNNSAIVVGDNQILEFNNANIKGFDENAIYLDGTGLAQAVLNTSGKMSIDNNIASSNSANHLKMSGSGTLDINGTVDNLTLINENSNTVHNNKVTNSTYNFNSGTSVFAKDEYLSDNNNSLIFNGGTLSIANGAVNQINVNGLSLNSNSNLMVDADLAAGEMDTINASNLSLADDVKLNVSGINLLSDSTEKYTEINFVNDETLKEHITTSVQSVAYSPIYRYGVDYDPTSGSFGFTRGIGNKYSEVNPAIMVAPVAAQIGGYLTQLNTYDQAFANMDMTMLMTRKQRQALKLHNKYAYDGYAPVGIIPDKPGIVNEEKAGIWARPYTTFENVKLKNGPKVSNVMYGTFFGGDTSIKELGHGFDGIFSAYAGYNGSHQNFDGNSLYQNGASVGVTGTLYKGNWYGGWTIAGGINGVDASTMYGSDNFMMWMAGTALKTGYNWELFHEKFIIQPHLMASYTFVDTEDFRNSASYKITSDPLNAIQIVPGIKFIGNLRNSWQPYVGIDYVWNIMDKTKFNAAEASLPQLSVKPYIQYGIGVQKRWGDRMTGFLQAMFRGGGRNGVIFSFGLRSTLGK